MADILLVRRETSFEPGNLGEREEEGRRGEEARGRGGGGGELRFSSSFASSRDLCSRKLNPLEIWTSPEELKDPRTREKED